MESLFKLLKEHILTEGRKEDVMAKYTEVKPEIIEEFSTNDPSDNNKYLEWMVKAYIQGGEVGMILNLVSDFNSKLPLLSTKNVNDFLEAVGNKYSNDLLDKFKKAPKDINNVKDITFLNDLITFLSGIKTKKQQKVEIDAETDRVYEDDDIVVVSPKTHKSSCRYGVHSSWCVATDNAHHFNSYTKNGTLYFFISKKDVPITPYWADKDEGKPPYKTALLVYDDGNISWWSKGDSNYSNSWSDPNKLPFFNNKMATAVQKHNKERIKKRTEEQLEIILATKDFYNNRSNRDDLRSIFNTFINNDLLTKQQFEKVLYNGNWAALYQDNKYGQKLISILKDDIYEITSKMVDSHGEKNRLYELLMELSQNQYLNRISDMMTVEQNQKIAQHIIAKNGGSRPTISQAGPNTKVYIDKWSMPQSELDKYLSTSYYFYILDGDGNNIMKIVSSDRFNPNDHGKVQMLRFEAKRINGSLHIIATDKGMLDSYMDQEWVDVPDNVLDYIKKTGKLIAKD